MTNTKITIDIFNWDINTSQEEISSVIKALQNAEQDILDNKKGQYNYNTYPINGIECTIKWNRK